MDGETSGRQQYDEQQDLNVKMNTHIRSQRFMRVYKVIIIQTEDQLIDKE